MKNTQLVKENQRTDAVCLDSTYTVVSTQQQNNIQEERANICQKLRSIACLGKTIV